MSSEVPATIGEEFQTEIQGRIDQLKGLVDLLQVYGKVVNLTGSLKTEDIWMELAEALVAYRAISSCVPRTRSWLDIGSGGGLPGLIFGILLADDEEAEGVLVEPRKRRADFLSLAISQLRIPRMSVVRAKLLENGKMEPKLETRKPEWVSARAVFAPDEWRKRAATAWPDALCMVHGQCTASENRDLRQELSWEGQTVQIWSAKSDEP